MRISDWSSDVCSSDLPPPQQAPSVPATPAPQPNANWRDRPVSPGEWSYQQDGSGSAAQYVNMSRTTDLFIRCDKSLRRIQIARAGSVSANGAQMIVRTSFGDALWPARNVTGSPSSVAADVDPRDPWFDKIAFRRGRIAVEVTGLPPLTTPGWPEIVRVIEDCRA